MKRSAILRCGLTLVFGAWLGGCSAWKQSSQEALIRNPGDSGYKVREPTAKTAGELSPFAILSSNVYHGTWKDEQPNLKEEESNVKEIEQTVPGEAEKDSLGADVAACIKDQGRVLPLKDWEPWESFPSADLIRRAERLGLYVEVWESARLSTVAVVFKGTEFRSRMDWLANLHGFSHLIPHFSGDQYTVLSKYLGKEFVDELARRHPTFSGAEGRPLQIVSTGHSLGGGLAQFFAYSLPAETNDHARVSHVYAFDPSPVTGWFSVGNSIRAPNIKNLKIDRVFEHGEILAYVRLLLGYVNPPPREPAVRQIRYNFERSANILASHSMLRLACELAFAKNGTAEAVAKK